MVSPRTRAVAAPLPDGRVLIAGGANGPALATAEVFDPVTGTFSAAGVGGMKSARANAAAAPLPDGRVLIAGGSNFSVKFNSASAEVFDPVTGTFSSTGIGSMSVDRITPAAAPLADGRVLIAGGAGSKGEGPGGWYSSAEVFDPATNTFSSAGIGAMGTPRSLAAASPLPDGRVLLAGGYRSPGGSGGGLFFDTAEVFVPEPSPSGAGLDFGSHDVGQTSAAKQLKITNLGVQALEIAGADLVGANADDFALAEDGCQGLVLAFKEHCTMLIQFAPSGPGARLAAIRITDNASTSPQAFQLSGVGTPESGQGPGPGPALESAIETQPDPQESADPADPAFRPWVRCKPRRRKVRCAIGLQRGSSRISRLVLARHGHIYASGRPITIGSDVRLHFTRRHLLPPGRYTLTVASQESGQTKATRSSVEIRQTGRRAGHSQGNVARPHSRHSAVASRLSHLKRQGSRRLLLGLPRPKP